MLDLKDYRREIDRIDESIIRAIAERFKVCEQVAAYKKRSAIPMMQADRIDEVKRRNRSLALQAGVDPTLIESIYDLIIAAACEMEERIIGSAE